MHVRIFAHVRPAPFASRARGGRFALNAKILVATTKPYWMPDDDVYLPVRVGAALADDAGGLPPRFARDDAGEDISQRNPRYCELTALYWGWKNLDCDYLGLVHHRRHFRGSGPRRVLRAAELDALLEQAPVLVGRPRDYRIETVESHYAHTFDGAHLDAVRATLAAGRPAFLDAFEQVLGGTRLHICNMAVMRRDILDRYCTWLFDVLFACERRIDFSGMSPFEERVMGRLAERLLDTWLVATGTPFAECPVVSLEKTNWAKKGGAFLAAKFLGRPYRQSF